MSDEALTDSQIFAEATAPEPAPQPRDEAGRFAQKVEAPPPEPPKVEAQAESKIETPKVEPATPAVQEPEDRQGIPAWRLREEAEAKREALKRAETAEADRSRFERQVFEMQQRLSAIEKPKVQEEVPDPLLDPQGYRAHFERQMDARLQNQQREFDMRLAHSRHGKVFEQAYAEAQQAIAYGDNQLSALMQTASSPGETLVQWYKQRQTMREVGDDPNAWLERKLEERMKDPAFLAKAMEAARGHATANPPSRPAVNLPPSLSSMSPALAQSNDPEAEDNSDAAVFKQAFRRR